MFFFLVVSYLCTLSYFRVPGCAHEIGLVSFQTKTNKQPNKQTNKQTNYSSSSPNHSRERSRENHSTTSTTGMLICITNRHTVQKTMNQKNQINCNHRIAMNGKKKRSANTRNKISIKTPSPTTTAMRTTTSKKKNKKHQNATGKQQ